MIKLLLIGGVVCFFMVPIVIGAWKIYRRLHPALKSVESMTPEEFTHLHLDKSMTAIELMAAKNELRDKEQILTKRKEIELVKEQIAQIDQQLDNLNYPRDDGPSNLSSSPHSSPRILQ